MASLRVIAFFLILTYGLGIHAAENLPNQPILGLVNTSQNWSEDHILEFWGYHSYLGSENYDDTLNLRYYNPINIDTWHGLVRLDTAYSAFYGPLLPNQSTGNFSANNAMLTIWGGQADWFANLGARLYAPLSNQGQWAIGPQVSTSFKPADPSKHLLADISPLARYMFGFNSKAPSGTPLLPVFNRLELYPTIGLNLGPNTQLRFWDENGILYNSTSGGWFIPIDAMLTYRLNKHLLLAVGAAKQVVQNYQVYDWTAYGKISINF